MVAGDSGWSWVGVCRVGFLCEGAWAGGMSGGDSGVWGSRGPSGAYVGAWVGKGAFGWNRLGQGAIGRNFLGLGGVGGDSREEWGSCAEMRAAVLGANVEA